ncbi:hypothetical protein [Pseudonocardia alni]|uniref:hypothetical protein n=1 Tax=Pseudonocardia alni TaxID=33907 RepID=UPI0027A57C9D|nr:hypothetical protein PaSha_12715 [Pseudonocardia alni]
MAALNDHYELLTPAQAVDRLAAELPGGRADAEQIIASYLRDATGVHGRPSSGWRLDEFDLDDARARFGWVDFAHGETVATARTRADATAIAALREARGTSAVTERDRLAGLHSDAEMWGYRAHSVGLDELTDRTACDPQPRLVTVAREGRERSHREATAAHDARALAAEAAADAERTAAACGHGTPDRPTDSTCDDTRTDEQEETRVHAPTDDRHRPRVTDAEMRRASEVLREVQAQAFADQLDEEAAPLLTAEEADRLDDLVRDIRAHLAVMQLDDEPHGRSGGAAAQDADGAGWER